MYHKIDKNSWWRINRRKGYTFTIEWTPKMGGVVRAKLDDYAFWAYEPCPCVESAEIKGWRIIDMQKIMREAGDDFDDTYEIYYHGA